MFSYIVKTREESLHEVVTTSDKKFGLVHGVVMSALDALQFVHDFFLIEIFVGEATLYQRMIPNQSNHVLLLHIALDLLNRIDHAPGRQFANGGCTLSLHLTLLFLQD